MEEKETRNFALRDKDGNEIGVFTGKQPRQAALKAANRGYTEIRLRERGTKKVHIFIGERKQVKKLREGLHGCLPRSGNPRSRK
ncbi:MAG TPA: non-histone chromosomal MC1 family protein [Methanothrix sp.]|nr:non-histone chromosomal MC1 family protein [Methanothrix sp.]